MSNERNYRILATRAEFQQALNDAMDEIATHGGRELFLCDEDFGDWPLGQTSFIERLTRWALPHRRLVLLARSFETVPARHPRFVTWRRHWSHIIEAKALAEAEPDEVPTLLLAPGVVSVRLFDRVHARGSLSHDAADAVRYRELVEAISQRAVDAFPATNLGL